MLNAFYNSDCRYHILTFLFVLMFFTVEGSIYSMAYHLPLDFPSLTAILPKSFWIMSAVSTAYVSSRQVLLPGDIICRWGISLESLVLSLHLSTCDGFHSIVADIDSTRLILSVSVWFCMELNSNNSFFTVIVDCLLVSSVSFCLKHVSRKLWTPGPAKSPCSPVF